jgi:hypothetical protein
MTEAKRVLQTRCCIAGGGPAGMVLGYLLARAGVRVVVLEKHADFLRDFRGDTVHPSTLGIMYELGLLDKFLKQPHQVVRELAGIVNGEEVKIATLSELPTRCKFIALMPQWEFLNFLAEEAKKFPEFALRLLLEPLRSGAPTLEQLEEVQKRREWPTKLTQRVQIFMHKNILSRALNKAQEEKAEERRGAPPILKIMQRISFLRRIPGRVFAVGVRPEHVSAEIAGARQAQNA